MRHRFVTGFTLIELLVVVTIITLVAGVVIAVTNSTRLAAHDARRKSDVSIIQSASELYYQKTGHYLDAQAAGAGVVTEKSGDVGYGWLSYQNPTEFIAPLKQTGLLGAAPRDPVNEDMRGSGKGEFGYAWISNFNDSRKVFCSDPDGVVPFYTIEVTLEVKNIVEKDLTPLKNLNTAACGSDDQGANSDNNPNGYIRYVRYAAP